MKARVYWIDPEILVTKLRTGVFNSSGEITTYGHYAYLEKPEHIKTIRVVESGPEPVEKEEK